LRSASRLREPAGAFSTREAIVEFVLIVSQSGPLYSAFVDRGTKILPEFAV
jgi:hypothetical protein